jgi:hypothetical protein
MALEFPQHVVQDANGYLSIVDDPRDQDPAYRRVMEVLQQNSAQ